MTQRVLAMIALAFVSLPVWADRGCSPDSKHEHIEYAKKLIGSFPPLPNGAAGNSRFLVKSEPTGAVRLSYLAQGKRIFESVAPDPDSSSNVSGCALAARPLSGKGWNGLGISFSCGSRMMSAGCEIRVRPVGGRDGRLHWAMAVVDDPNER